MKKFKISPRDRESRFQSYARRDNYHPNKTRKRIFEIDSNEYSMDALKKNSRDKIWN